MDKFEEAYKDLENDPTGNLWDDAHEWDKQIIMDRYGMSSDEANVFWLYIQSRTDHRYDFYNLDRDEHGKAFLEGAQESYHQGHDGWSIHEQVIISAFCADLALYATSYSK